MNANLRSIFGVIKVLVLIDFALSSNTSWAEWAAPDQTVPLDRLVANAKQHLEVNPNDAHVWFWIGRAYSLAYAIEKREFGVYDKSPGMFENAYDPPRAPVSVNSKRSPEQITFIVEAIVHYERSVTFDDAQPYFWLGLGWMYEEGSKRSDQIRLPASGTAEPTVEPDRLTALVRGLGSSVPRLRDRAKSELSTNADNAADQLFTLIEKTADELAEPAIARESANALLRRAWEDRALTAYRKAYDMAAGEAFKNKMYSEIAIEAAGGIETILTSRADVSPQELKDLKKQSIEIKKIQSYPQAVTPMVFGLSPSTRLSDVIYSDMTRSFDLDGFGVADRWPWVSSSTYFLVWDPKHEGKITSGRQLFGSVTWWLFWRNGFEPLAALDDNRDGWLRNDELDGIAAWQDRDSSATSSSDEVTPIRELGISAIATTHAGRDAGYLWNPRGIELVNGQALPMWDWEPTSLGIRKASNK